jgi:hypothetical protein
LFFFQGNRREDPYCGFINNIDKAKAQKLAKEKQEKGITTELSPFMSLDF